MSKDLEKALSDTYLIGKKFIDGRQPLRRL